MAALGNSANLTPKVASGEIAESSSTTNDVPTLVFTSASDRIPQCGVGGAMGAMGGALGKENAPTSKRMPPSTINTRPHQAHEAPECEAPECHVVLPKIFVVSLH